MHHEATKSPRVTAPARARECKEPSAPGEVSVKALSDGGSTPPTSTMKETSFVYQDKRGFFLHFGQILSKYGQIGDWIGLRSSFAAASEPDFCVFGAR